MLKRELYTECLEMAKYFPILTILGPRQAGKSTLAKVCFPDKPRVNLEKIDVRQFAEQDPNAFLAQYIASSKIQ